MMVSVVYSFKFFVFSFVCLDSLKRNFLPNFMYGKGEGEQHHKVES